MHVAIKLLSFICIIIFVLYRIPMKTNEVYNFSAPLPTAVNREYEVISSLDHTQGYARLNHHLPPPPLPDRIPAVINVNQYKSPVPEENISAYPHARGIANTVIIIITFPEPFVYIFSIIYLSQPV